MFKLLKSETYEALIACEKRLNILLENRSGQDSLMHSLYAKIARLENELRPSKQTLTFQAQKKRIFDEPTSGVQQSSFYNPYPAPFFYPQEHSVNTGLFTSYEPASSSFSSGSGGDYAGGGATSSYSDSSCSSSSDSGSSSSCSSD